MEGRAWGGWGRDARRTEAEGGVGWGTDPSARLSPLDSECEVEEPKAGGRWREARPQEAVDHSGLAPTPSEGLDGQAEREPLF